MIQRDHSLDAARGFLMVLGIVLHAANIYTPSDGWYVHDAPGHPLFAWLGSAIHTLRMPAFFWIAGFFTAMTLARPGRHQQLERRLFRIALPLLVTWATLNPLQQALAPARAGTDAAPFGVPLYHLWFLVDLLVFTALSFAAARLLALTSLRALPVAADNPVLFIVGMALLSWGLNMLVRLSGQGYVDLLGLTSLFRLATNLPFFAAGLLLYGNPRALAHHTRTPAALLLLLVPLLVWLEPLDDRGPRLQREAALLATLLATLTAVGALIGLFRRWFSKPTPHTVFLASAALTVYLFHHLVVMALGLLLLDTTWPIALKYGVVCAGTLALCAGIHRGVIARLPLLALAYNGRPLPETRRSAQRSPGHAD